VSFDERKNCNLAQLEISADYHRTLSMPFHSREGQPFDPSLDVIAVTYPRLVPGTLLRSLGERISQ
jgi:hypothetical protein